MDTYYKIALFDGLHGGEVCFLDFFKGPQGGDIIFLHTHNLDLHLKQLEKEGYACRVIQFKHIPETDETKELGECFF